MTRWDIIKDRSPTMDMIYRSHTAELLEKTEWFIQQRFFKEVDFVEYAKLRQFHYDNFDFVPMIMACKLRNKDGLIPEILEAESYSNDEF